MAGSRHGCLADTLLVLFAAIYLTVGGVTLMQGLVNYPTWRDMGPMMSNEDFLALREAHYWKIYPLAVIPGSLALPLNIALLFVRPTGVPVWLTGLVLALSLVVAVATFAFEIPRQDILDARGYDRSVIDALIQTDLLFRKLPGVAAMALVGVMVWMALRRRTTA